MNDDPLRRLAVRLTRAAAGRSTAMDAALDGIRGWLRGDTGDTAFDGLLDALADAVVALDASHDAAPAEVAPGLLDLIDGLRAVPGLDAELGRLAEQVRVHPDADAQADHARELAALLNRHRTALREDRERVEQLLHQFSAQLETLAGDVLATHALHADADASRAQLDRAMQGELRDLGAQAEQSADLQQLRERVGERLQTLGAHLRAFRQREDSRASQWQQREQAMQARIESLEGALRAHRRLVLTDPLTGIANRLAFEERMALQCRRLAADTEPASLLVLDIDHFKRINDRYGHGAGDRALSIVARQLRDALARPAFLARYGGEEFAAILPGHDRAQALEVADTLRRHIGGLGFHVEQQPVRVTLSCGLTQLRPGDEPQRAFERADQALYRAKRGGRDRCIAD